MQLIISGAKYIAGVRRTRGWKKVVQNKSLACDLARDEMEATTGSVAHSV